MGTSPVRRAELDWIVMDPEIDFGELFKQYDTAVMGRRTFEVMLKEGGNGSMPGLDVVVFSQTGDTSRNGNLCTLRRAEAVSGYSEGSEPAFSHPFI